MDINNIKLFNLMQSNLSYLTARQGILSQNIANASTPNYQAKDLVKPDFSAMMKVSAASGMATTNSAHITGINSAGSGNKFSKIDSKSFEVTPSGNSVTLEDEISKLSMTATEYQETTGIYRKMMEMLKTAIGNV